MKKTLNLKDFINRENVNSQRKDGLILFDYNKLCGYQFDWDEITLNARGIIFEEATGKIVGRGYKKFFNYEELNENGMPSERSQLLPIEFRPNITGKFRTLEKADGSLGICFYYNNKWYVTTRGSFVSDQALWAQAFLYENVKVDLMNKNYSYLFEIIYPENRIVIDYKGKKSLVLTGIIDTESGEEFWSDVIEAEAKKIGCETVKQFNFSKFEDLFKFREGFTENEEGIVVTFENGYKMKLKGEIYCRIHRQMCNVTPLAFWNNFCFDTYSFPTEFLSDLPEEFKNTVDILKDTTISMHKNEFDRIKSFIDLLPVFSDDASGKKERYFYLTKNYKPCDVSKILSYLSGKSANYAKLKNIIHREVRPTGNKYPDIEIDTRISRALEDN